MKTTKIHVFTTGGTIDKVYFDGKSEFQVGPPTVDEIFREANVTAEVSIEPVMAKDSLDLADADRRLLRERVLACGGERILITHGTDTMAETARALADIPGKVIVLTGALQPTRFRHTDAMFNIGFALGAMQCLSPGVYLALNGRLFDPTRVRKNREKQCFEEIN